MEIVCVACGAPIEYDDDHPNWSQRTQLIDGIEHVVERHLSLTCPQCGRSETPIARDERGLVVMFEHEGEQVPLRAFNLVVRAVDPPERVNT